MSEALQVTQRGPVLEIVLNRPKANAIDLATSRIMGEVFTAFRDDPELRVAILTAAGEKFFCPGWDLKAAAEGEAPDSDYGVGGFGGLQELPGLNKPVICAVNGYAIGGGHVIHVICDVTIAAEHAKFGQAGPRVGSFDAGWGSAYLARTVGEKRAREIWFFCQQYDAQTALQWGLVNKVVPADKLMEEARAMAAQAVALSPTALKFLKHAFNADSAHIFGQVKMAADGLASFVNSEEASEGRNAFLEKRKPNFDPFR